MSDFLSDQSSIELTTWITYERMEEESRSVWLSNVIATALRPAQKPTRIENEEDEEVFDTTAPEFAEHFQGFSNSTQRVQSRPRQQGTEIRQG